jgi:long-subunit fatty acid transport protein
LGARNKAMGGAGTALANDFSAVFYNPGQLSACPHNSISINYFHTDHALRLQPGPTQGSYPEPEPIPPRDWAAIGICVKLPLRLSFGFHYAMNLQRPMAMSHDAIDPKPQFALHNKRLDGFSIMTGLSFAILDNLSIGGAVSILSNSTLYIENNIPVVTGGKVVDNVIHWDLTPTVAPYFGARWQIVPELGIGAAYRFALYHQLEVDARTRVELAGVLIDLDLLMQGSMWYSPQQMAFGMTYAPVRQVTLSADLTWYNWSAYPGPFVVSSPRADSAVARSLTFPPREPPGFVDIWVPRFGAEYVWANRLAARLGYSFRPTPAPVPKGTANLLDADLHVMSAGLGYHWAPEPVLVHTAAEPSFFDLDFGIAGLRLDAYFQLGIMPSRTVKNSAPGQTLTDFSFGGHYLDVGVTASLEY